MLYNKNTLMKTLKEEKMKKINIFLASSIVEFANERMMVENFIRNISDNFEEKYNIKIQPLLCENFDDAYSFSRKQEEYNQKIRESEFCFFIFFTKVGKYTHEEFEVAKEQFEKTKKPKIYTYFKTIEEGKAEENPERYSCDLAMCYGNIGILYTNIRKPFKAKKYYQKSIDEYETLAEKNPERFNPDLAMSYFNYAVFRKDITLVRKAHEIAKTAPSHPLCKTILQESKKICAD